MVGQRIDFTARNPWRKEFQVYVPEGFEGPPTSGLDILKRAYATCEEEGRWRTGAWFKNLHPSVNPEDAFCNNWSACADGLILAVSVGASRYRGSGIWDIDASEFARGDDEVARMVQEARRLMHRAGREVFNVYSASVPNYNDYHCPSRTEALRWFARAIQLGEEAEAAAQVPVDAVPTEG